MVVHSHDLIKLLHILKQIHTEIASLRDDVTKVQDTLQRMEDTGFVVNLADTDSDTGSSESSEQSTASAPF